jgi:hypothetical protein
MDQMRALQLQQTPMQVAVELTFSLAPLRVVYLIPPAKSLPTAMVRVHYLARRAEVLLAMIVGLTGGLVAMLMLGVATDLPPMPSVVRW